MGEVEKMNCFLAALGEQSNPNNSDIRWASYVIYMNTFLKRFGQERIHLVGSTGEGTKLHSSKDDGDADFIIVSGIYEVEFDQLEYNEYNNCYLRIRADERSKALGIETVDGKYISTDYLRFMKPELYSILRAIYSHVTATRSAFPITEEEHTFIAVPSKVGLASSRYSHLKLDKSLETRLAMNRLNQASEGKMADMSQTLKERWNGVEVNESDLKIFRRTINILDRASKAVDKTTFTAELAGMIKEIMKRPPWSINKLHKAGETKESRNTETREADTKDDDINFAEIKNELQSIKPKDTESQNKLESTAKESVNETKTHNAVTHGDDHCDTPINAESQNEHAVDIKSQDAVRSDNDLDLSAMRNTYQAKYHMDFVPVMKLKGKLDIMKQWRQRAEHANMDRKLIDTIYDVDIFVVSRIAPKHSNVETDYCLSFNIAETKLVSSLPSLLKKVFLIMKAFLKGLFETQHAMKNKELKLKTYHVKNSICWLRELNPELSFVEDTTENIMIVLQRATQFLKEKLEQRMLPHYFVGSNLFSEFEDADYPLLLECVDKVLSDPVGSLQCYFDLDDGKPCDIELTEEEVTCLIEMSKDGGKSKHMYQLEDALIDLHRGFNLGPRDGDQKAPIKEAILDVFRLFVNDERIIDTKIFQQINSFLTKGVANSIPEINEQIRKVANLLDVVGIFNPNLKQFIKQFGGRPGLEEFLRGAYSGEPIDFTKPLAEQLLETIDRYLSCGDDEEDAIAGELIYKLVGYFSGRKEFPRLSELA